VADAAVIGIPDATWGESVHAVVIAVPGAQPQAAELIGWCRERLARAVLGWSGPAGFVTRAAGRP
ncbi:MAG TPA: acyl-CoA synthetase, partial [Streptosporangiaceae bacterium]|nr:acyl-CoA synthetase [Streptosporangiaceae bacterium]